MTARLRWAFCLLGLVALSALWTSDACALPPRLQNAPVTAIELDPQSAQAIDIASLPIEIGDRLTRTRLRQVVQNLVATGQWADVQIKAMPAGEGVRLFITLSPRVVLTRIDIYGNSLLDDDSVLRTLDLREGMELVGDVRSRIPEQLMEAYRSRGYIHADVNATLLDTDDPARRVLVLRIYEGPPLLVRSVSFRSEHVPQHIDAADLLGVALREPFDENGGVEKARKAESTLRNLGYLEARIGKVEVTRDAQEIVLTVPAHFGPRYDVEIGDASPLSRSTIESALNLTREPLSKGVLQGIAQQVTDVYAKYGFSEARTDVRVRRGVAPNTATLHIRPKPGRRRQVAAVAFPGAQHFEHRFLREQLGSYLEEDLPSDDPFEAVNTNTIEALGFGGRPRSHPPVPPPLDVNPALVYYAPTYKEALEHVTELYQAAGYLKAQVGPEELRDLEDDKLLVSVPVNEGPRTFLYALEVRGNKTVGSRALLRATSLQRDEPFSYLALEQARLQMLETYRERGYLYARVEPTVQFSNDTTRARVVFEIVESYPVYVADVEIEGAERTLESLIRDRLKLYPGELLAPSKLQRAQERLLSLGVFTSVHIGPVNAEVPERTKTLVVTVHERLNQYLEFRLGLSSGEGLRGGFDYGYRNLFGYAISLNLSVQLAYQFFFVDPEIEQRFRDARLSVNERLERNIALGLTIPHVSKLPDVQLSVGVLHVRDNERDFGLDKNATNLTLTYRPMQALTMSISEVLENNLVDLFTSTSINEFLAMVPAAQRERLERLLRVPDGESTILATEGSVALDYRDSAFEPTKGYLGLVSAEYARTLESRADKSPTDFTSHFIKLTVTANGYIPLGKDVVLANQIKGGRVFHLEDASKTYPNRAYYLGGVDTMRGFLQDAMIPQDLADAIQAEGDLSPDTVVRAGDTFVLLRSELRFPLVGDLRGGIFADIGNVWADATKLNPIDLRPTAGFGLRLSTPVGPIAFDYGFVLARRRDLKEPFGTFHFSIGLF